MYSAKSILNKTRFNDDFKCNEIHQNLVAEMEIIENLTTAERLQLAKMRRAQQLKLAKQNEKEWIKFTKQNKKCTNLQHSVEKHISFENSVVLLEAASRNDTLEVAELLNKGISPNVCNEDGLTALHQCCIDNKVDMLNVLLENGANVNAEDSDKWTPLHAAATCGHLPLVKILIAHGANLLSVNTDGNMPYDLCDDEETLDYIECEMSKRSITQELIDDIRAVTERTMLQDLILISSDGGDLEIIGYQGETFLHTACANGYISVVEFLLSCHVNPDVIDKDLWTPTHAAACWGHLEVLEQLAQYGADLSMENKDGETPMDICEDPEIKERLQQLKFEQENKRITDAQRKKVKRSQSNNTRAQSVRRTSLRDKTMTTKKDAVEEARLRLRAQEAEHIISPQNTTVPLVKTNSNEFTNILRRSDPEGQDEAIDIENSPSLIKTTNSVDNFSTEIFQANKDNGKINVQVTVLVDTQNIDSAVSRATLSNLKKQRMQYRNLGSSVANVGDSSDQSEPSHNENNVASKGKENFNEIIQFNKSRAYVNKFSGVAASEFVPDTTSYKKCCCIS